jgi:hypothetical protein
MDDSIYNPTLIKGLRSYSILTKTYTHTKEKENEYIIDKKRKNKSKTKKTFLNNKKIKLEEGLLMKTVVAAAVVLAVRESM